jgi:hypothetical protein
VTVTVNGISSNTTNFLVTPGVNSLSPSVGPVGTSIAISGTSFGATQGSSTVTFNGVTATTVGPWSDTSITAVVPVGATTGNVVVTAASGIASNGISFTVVPAPGITSLTPSSGTIGSSVVIAGSGFGTTQGTSTVKFNGVTATTVGPWSDTSITAVVPAGATTGNIIVTTAGGASNGINFTVVPTPSITGLTPSSGVIGTSVVIAGSGFGESQGTGTVKFNGVTATTVGPWSDTSITAVVPTGATTGNVVVTTAGGIASNGMLFTVNSTQTGSFARVQMSSRFSGSSGTSSLSVGSGQGWVSSTAGNAIVVACGVHTAAPVPTITDNMSDTYTLIKSVADGSPATLALYILPNNPGGVTSITCTPNAFTTMTTVVMELRGVATVSATDQSAGNDNGFGGANPWTSNSTAVQGATNEYGIGVAYEFRLGLQTFVAGSGWTAIGTDSAGTIFFEEQNPVSGTSAIAATGTISTTTNAQVMAIAATLKAP